MNSISFLSTSAIMLEVPSEIWHHLDTSKKIQYFCLGRQSYIPVWNLQKELHSRRVAGEISDVVLFVEHEPVYTFGKNSDLNLLLDSKPQDAEVAFRAWKKTDDRLHGGLS